MSILDRMPPQDIEAERQTIGSIVLDPSRIEDVAPILRPEDFYADSNRRIFAALLHLADAGLPIDATLLVQHLRKTKQIEAAGGTAYVAELLGNIPVTEHAEHYAKIVAAKSKYRGLITTSADALRRAYAEDGEPSELIDSIETDLLSIESRGERGPVSAGDATVAAMVRIDEIASRQRTAGHLIGLHEFDEKIGGVFSGELFVLAARPGFGKTSLACQIAHHLASRGQSVGFFSLEMRAAELMTRVVCSQARVDSRLIRRGTLEDEHLVALGGASQPMVELPWLIYDRPSQTISSIRRWCVRQKRKGLDLVVVDYLTRLTPEEVRGQNRYIQIGQMTRGLKSLAVEMDVCVLCVAQLGRAAETERVRLSHLRESGDIEQDADVVAFIRKSTAKESEDRPDCDRCLEIAKNRNGETGSVPLKWIPHETRFEDGSGDW
jgi:replicative DNA helicase